MTDAIRIQPDSIVAAGEVCFQTTPKSDVQTEQAFINMIQPLFNAVASKNGVSFSALVVDGTTGTKMVDGQAVEDPTALLWRATATAQ